MISEKGRKALHELLDRALDCGGSVGGKNGFQVVKLTGERYLLVSWIEGQDEWPDIPDTPEQRALIASHNAGIKAKYPHAAEIGNPHAERTIIMEAREANNPETIADLVEAIIDHIEDQGGSK